jgi:hypothetical protein
MPRLRLSHESSIETSTQSRSRSGGSLLPLRALFAWLERTGHAVDIEALRRRYPEVGWHHYEDWARLQASRFADHCPHPPAFAH